MAENVPTIRLYPLEKRKIIKKFIAGMPGFTVIFLVVALLTVLINIAGFGLVLAVVELVGFILFAAFYLWYQSKYYEKYFYDITDEFLVIKKGVFMPRETILPYEKLQDVYMDQDILDRVFSLWDLHVSTATFTSGSEAHIDGVNSGNGEAMKKMILAKIKESKKK